MAPAAGSCKDLIDLQVLLTYEDLHTRRYRREFSGHGHHQQPRRHPPPGCRTLRRAIVLLKRLCSSGGNGHADSPRNGTEETVRAVEAKKPDAYFQYLRVSLRSFPFTKRTT